jgi:hypothetical protein
MPWLGPKDGKLPAKGAPCSPRHAAGDLASRDTTSQTCRRRGQFPRVDLWPAAGVPSCSIAQRPSSSLRDDMLSTASPPAVASRTANRAAAKQPSQPCARRPTILGPAAPWAPRSPLLKSPSAAGDRPPTPFWRRGKVNCCRHGQTIEEGSTSAGTCALADEAKLRGLCCAGGSSIVMRSGELRRRTDAWRLHLLRASGPGTSSSSKDVPRSFPMLLPQCEQSDMFVHSQVQEYPGLLFSHETARFEHIQTWRLLHAVRKLSCQCKTPWVCMSFLVVDLDWSLKSSRVLSPLAHLQSIDAGT